ncbi:MAG: outer rane lipoproteinsorting protein [Flavipsychrobacter sp.]|nr:outer rane lipoproteinsorting protein [Flavipsychrobacter sp.]
MFAAALSATISATAQTGDEIMEKHEKAIGGVESWNKINSVILKGAISQGGMEIPITQTIVPGKAMRTDIAFMGMSGFSIVTKTDGWMYMPFSGSKKVDTMKPDMVKASQKQMDLKGQQLLDYKAQGKKAEFAGKDSVKSTVCYKVKLSDKDGNDAFGYFDCATYYLLRFDTKVKTDEQEEEVSVSFGDYKKVDNNIVFPHSITLMGTAVTLASVDFNKPVDDNLFVPKIPEAAETDKK